MPLNNGDIVNLSIAGRCFGQRILLTHNYRISGTGDPLIPTSTALQSFLDDFKAGGTTPLRANYLAVLPPEYELDFVRAQVIEPVRSAYVQDETWDGNGTYAGTTETSNQTAVISMRTENGGRSQVGNKHIGPLPLGAQVNGLVSDAYKSLLGVLGNSLKQVAVVDNTGQSASPIIYHRGGGLAYDAITNFIVQSTVRTQRRRTVGLGE